MLAALVPQALARLRTEHPALEVRMHRVVGCAGSRRQADVRARCAHSRKSKAPNAA